MPQQPLYRADPGVYMINATTFALVNDGKVLVLTKKLNAILINVQYQQDLSKRTMATKWVAIDIETHLKWASQTIEKALLIMFNFQEQEQKQIEIKSIRLPYKD